MLTLLFCSYAFLGYKRDTGGPALSGAAAKRYRGGAKHSSTISTPSSAADVALMLTTAGVDSVISVDLQPPGRFYLLPL